MSASRSTSSPRSLPSESVAILIRWIWSRPWWTATLPSDRDSVHLTGLPELARDDERQHLLGGHLQLRPEAAAHVRGDHPQLVLGDAGDDGEHDPQDVRDLGRGPDGVLVGHRGRDHGARLHRARDEPLLAVGALDDYRRVGEGRVDVAIAERPGDTTCCRPHGPSATPARAQPPCPGQARAARSSMSMSSSASAAAYRSRATTAATISPAYRTVSTAIGGCGGMTMSSVTGQAHGSEPCSARRRRRSRPR